MKLEMGEFEAAHWRHDSIEAAGEATILRSGEYAIRGVLKEATLVEMIGSIPLIEFELLRFGRGPDKNG